MTRALRYLAPALTVAATVALWSGAASANWTGTVYGSLPNTYVQNNYYGSNGNETGDSCSAGATPGYIGNQNTDAYVNGSYEWEQTQAYYAYGTIGSLTIPAGTTLIAGAVNGTLVDNSGGTNSVQFTLDAANAEPSSSSCSFPSYSQSIQYITFPSVGSQASFSGDGYGIALGVIKYGWGYLFSELGGYSLEYGANPQYTYTGSISLSAEYAYTPASIGEVVTPSGTGHDTTIAWAANGNDGSTVYTLQRETLNSGGVSQSWTTIYQGTATSFNTQGTAYAQTCGVSYQYRVAVIGPDNQTPWDVSPQWDEAPCSGTLTVPAGVPNYINVSWPAGAPGAGFVLYWCVSSNCTESSWNVGAATSAQLTGLQPNTEYTVWICGDSSGWGCPSYAAWTYAAVPTLSPYNSGSGVPYNGQILTWSANGNPPGTVYDLQQGTYAQSGAWQGGTVIYSGTGTSYTANQTAGGSYAYSVWAINAGYGTGTAASNGVATQVASVPTLTATGATTATLSWPAVAYMSTVGVECQEPAGSAWQYVGEATGGATSFNLTGLSPNTQYYCATYAAASNQGLEWWEGSDKPYTAANPPASGGLSNIAETSMTANWSANGNPAGTQYYAVLQYFSGGSWLQESGWTAATSWTPTGLTPGTEYQINVEAENGSGQASAWTYVGGAYTVPAEPAITGGDGGLGWSATSGRGYVTLSWPASAGATGYTLYVYEGAEYEAFDLGGATSWDSRSALIYPTDASLYPNVASGSKSPPVLIHNGGGLNLRDLPNDLYCTTEVVGGWYCGGTGGNPQNYWFTVAAYNASGSSASFQVPGNSASSYYEPTLPLQTDPNPPAITGWAVNGGAAYTYSNTVPYSLSAAEGTSGIAAYALSNDGSTWWTSAVGGCNVGQVAPCQTSLSASGTWTLLPGPGSKTVWAKVESAAGVWSAPMATSVYVNADQATPTVDVALDGGAASTASTAATAAVTVSDPAAPAGVTWQARYSTDGGQTWSAWASEGTATAWSMAVTLPGGASGQRTVLVQAENSDQNLGQGGASIYYAAPGGGGMQPGNSAPAREVACTWPVGAGNVSATCITQPQVNLSLSPPSGAVLMRASLDGADWGPWSPVASALPLNLGSAPGLKTVWVQYQGSDGTVSADAAYNPGYFVLDPGPPAVQAAWLGGAAATDGGGNATLEVQASDPVGTAGMTLAVSENGAYLYQGAFEAAVPLTLTGSGYQQVQVTATDVAGNAATASLGIYAQ